MQTPEIVVTDQIDSALTAVIGSALNSFNDAVVGYSDRQPLAAIIRDPASGAVLGGAIGRTSLGLLFVDLVFLPPALRGAGLGTRLLRAVEHEALRRGCRAGVLYTISFQAPGFYERIGWRRFGEIACDPSGTSRVFLTKTLSA